MTPDEKAKYEEYLTLAKKAVEEEAEEYIKYKNGQNPDYQINDFNEEGMSMTINGEDIKTAPYSEDVKQVIANSMWKILFLTLMIGERV